MVKNNYNEIIKKYDKEIREKCGIYELNLNDCLKKNKENCKNLELNFKKCIINFDIIFHNKYIKNNNIKTYF